MKTIHARFLAALFLASVCRVWAADNDTFFFLKIESIPGESTVTGHVNEIDVLSYSTGASNSSTQFGGGGGSGKVNFQDLSLTKFVDGTSPALLLACASGQHFPSVELKGARRKNGTLQDYLTVKLSNVIVTSVSSGGSAGDQRLTENISINFTKIEFTVRKLNPDGTLGAPATMTWNIATNTGT